MSNDINDQLILITGFSGEGKSASLKDIQNQEKWMYLNCEAGKRLPFKNKFDSYRISDPYQVHEGLNYAIANPHLVDGVIIDSITFLMDMFETMYVTYATNTQTAWNEFAQFFRVLMQKITVFGKPTVLTAHLKDTLDEKNMEMKTKVPIKGALRNNGIEAWFSTIVCAKKVSIKDLEKYQNPMLNISEEEEIQGYKHVFQTKATKGTLGLSVRSPIGLFDKDHTFIDNNTQLLLNHLTEFYK